MIARFRRLARDDRGVSIIEFAFAVPIVLAMGGFGIELGNLAVTNMRVSQVALALADNASRIGVNNGQATYQLREGDMNDILQGARLMGQGIKLTTFGRVTISSVENVQRSYSDATGDSQAVQRLHWQRCIGAGKGATGNATAPSYDSNYGQATPLAKAATDTKQADAGPTTASLNPKPPVDAPSGGGTIFVEVVYPYQPLFGTMFVGKKILRYTGSFIVRDRRDFSQIYNPQTALGTTPTPSTCDLYGA